MSERNAGITPPEDGWYWRYDGEPTLLVGGSDTDNPFQWVGAGLESHLDDLVDAGGNFVRNTLSDRGRDDVAPFARVRDGVYDLERWNEPYWERLDAFLTETASRDVVVHLTLWDQHDVSGDRWADHYWNPANNVNYGRYESGLASGDDLFSAVDRNAVVYPYLRRFVDRVLDVCLDYDHVVYNVDNESWAGETWERHWAGYVRERAADAGESVAVTSMTMFPGQSVQRVLDHPDLFDFVDLSQVDQNSKGETGQAHWDAVQDWRAEIDDAVGPRPINHVKIYGSDAENPSAGSERDAVERFWRNLVGGCAAVRFHRPREWGIGLGERARSQIRSARELAAATDVFALAARTDLLADREPNEAYCAADAGSEYVVYFPDGGAVDLDRSAADGPHRLRWLDADGSEWTAERAVDGETVRLSAPGDGHWIAALTQ